MNNSLSRKQGPRKSLLRNLATSLILYEEIRTTRAKAKAVQPIVEKLISKTKKASSVLRARRELLGYLFDSNATKKMFEVIVPRFSKINFGFTQIIPFKNRLGDGAPMVILKFIDVKVEEKPGEKNGSSKKPAKKAGAKKTTK